MTPAPAAPAIQASHNTEILKATFNTAAQGVPAASTASQNMKGKDTSMFSNAPEVVREAMKINKMGKPIKWNYMTEAPSIRELGPEEIEEMAPLPLPDPSERLPWVRAWHPDAGPMKIGPHGETIERSVAIFFLSFFFSFSTMS